MGDRRRAAILVGLLALGSAACRASPTERRVAPPQPREMTIDLLAIDLETCGRCTGTERNLDAAFAVVARRLARQGVEVRVRKTVVRTAEQAEALRFLSSPTIRVDGRDIALEMRESDCKDCGDLCSGGTAVDCRVWVWRGREYVEAPTELIVDAVLRAYEHGPAAAGSAAVPYRLPDNLRRFFAAKR